MTRIRRIRTLDELDAIEKVWIGLERVDGGTSIFQSWTWNRIWCDLVLSSRRRARLDVRVVEDSAGQALAILPFYEEVLPVPFARITQFLGHRMSEYNDVLLADPRSSELAGEVVRALVNDLGSRTVLHLRHLNGQSAFTKQLVTLGVAEPQCTYLWLRADPLITDQRKRLGPSRGKSLRLAENRLRRQFKVRFCVRSGSDFSEAFDELIRLHYLRFGSLNRPTSLIGPSLTFLKTATLMLNYTDNSEIVQLQADGVAIAAVLMVRDKQRYFFLTGGFNPEFSRYSPMRLLLTETMRRGFEDLGYETYDLGAGYEPYKFDWSPIVGTNYMCSHGGRGPYAKLVAALYGFLFRRQLPLIPEALAPR